MIRPSVVSLAFLAGCPAILPSEMTRRQDRDQDGQIAEEYGGTDCDDDNAEVRASKLEDPVVERCDFHDNDCDGLLNEEDPDLADAVWFLDADDDGAGDPATFRETCASLGDVTVEGRQNPVWTADGTDCDDADPDQRPGQAWLLDGDGDGWGTPIRVLVQCVRPAAFVVAPGYSVETGRCAELACDCDDEDREVRPDALERCNGLDDDCDGDTDAQDRGGASEQKWYRDRDGDGFGDENDTSPAACPEEDRVANNGDCDDADSGRRPTAKEDGNDAKDEDCNPANDHDLDQDGHGAVEFGGDDCDDTRYWIHPTAPEFCNGVSERCAGDEWTPADELGVATLFPIGAVDTGAIGSEPPVGALPPDGAPADTGNEDGADPTNGGDVDADDIPIDFTDAMYGPYVELPAGELRLCVNPDEPFTAAVNAVNTVDIRGVTPDADGNLQPATAVFELAGTGGLALWAGGSVRDVEVRDAVDWNGLGCLFFQSSLSVAQTPFERVTLRRCQSNSGYGATVASGGPLTLADLTTVNTADGGVLVAVAPALTIEGSTLDVGISFYGEQLDLNGTVVTGAGGVTRIAYASGPQRTQLVDSTVSAEQGGVYDPVRIRARDSVLQDSLYGAWAPVVDLVGTTQVLGNRTGIHLVAGGVLTAEDGVGLGSGAEDNDRDLELEQCQPSRIDTITAPVTCEECACTP